MSRSWLRTMIVIVVLAACVSTQAQVPRNPPPNRPERSAENAAEPSPASASKFLTIPGLMPLSMVGVQREIGLSSEQKQQLQAVSSGYVAAMQQLEKSYRGFSPEEQQNRAKDINEQVAQIAGNARHKAEAILSPKQLQTVEKIAFQLSAAGALADPRLQEKLGLRPEQRQRLTAIYEHAAEQMQQLQRDTATQAVQAIDEEQTAELKKLIDTQPKTR